MQICEREDSWRRLEFVIEDYQKIFLRTTLGSTYFKFVKGYKDGGILFLINMYLFCTNQSMRSIKILNGLELPNPFYCSIYRLDSLCFDSLQKMFIGDDG